MEIDEFIKNFAAKFDFTDASEITPETHFQEMDEWDSLMMVMTMAMSEENYDVSITEEEIKKQVTVEDLFNLVKSKK